MLFRSAWNVLQAVAAGAYADAALERQFAKASLRGVDRALTTEIAYGAIRQRRLLDAWIDALGRVGAETAAAHLRVLADYFGRPYPYPKLDLVAVPDFLPGAMENPGLITFRDTALLLDDARASVQARHATYGIIAHELAHQWFGNLVTMAWWNDL